MTQHVLFVCTQNRLRSPTAERVFADWPGVQTASAGLGSDAEVAVSNALLEWADLVIVMEQVHRKRLSARFRSVLGDTPVVCLGIPDDYAFMAPELVQLLRAKVPQFLLGV